VTTRRPALPPSLRRLRRGPRTLQIGRDPARALVLDGVGPAEAAFLGLLDGPRERAEALRDAAEVGVPPQEAARLLSLLEGSGLLDDGAGDVTAVRRLTPADRDRLGPDLACWALLRGGTAGAARALGRRRAARVAVAGTGRVARAVADLLGAAGVGQVAEQDPATGDTLAVLCSDDGALVPPQLSDRRHPRRAVQRRRRAGAAPTERPAAPRRCRAPGRRDLRDARLGGAARRSRAQRLPARAAWTCTAATPAGRWSRPSSPFRRRSRRAATACSPPRVAAHAALAAVAHLDDPAAPSPLEGALTEFRLAGRRAATTPVRDASRLRMCLAGRPASRSATRRMTEQVTMAR